MEKRNVVWLVGYPKSGNTWLASLLEVAGRGFGYPQGNYDIYNMERVGASPAICPAVLPAYGAQPCSILKTHARYHARGLAHRLPGMELASSSFIHIYRNPLDVLLSYLNYTRIEYGNFLQDEYYKRKLFVELLGFPGAIDYERWRDMTLERLPQRNLDHALDHFSTTSMSIDSFREMSGTWAEHVESWKAAAADLPGHSIRYEECVEDPGTFRRLSDMFVFDGDRIEAAANFVTARDRKYIHQDVGHARLFYNKMQAGYFREFFSRAAITRFMRANEGILVKHGYAHLLEVA